jgi:uncharacterized phage-associated protein
MALTLPSVPMTGPADLPRWPFRFDPEKALEALLYVIPRIKRPTLHSVSKILYHADRMHLSAYGRPISGDRYAAMKHGPVPSTTYNLLKGVKGVEVYDLPGDAASALSVENGKDVSANRAPLMDVLSQSEIECLERSCREHGAKSFKALTDESHDAAWDSADENDLIELEGFLLTLANRDELREHFLHDGQ